MKSKQEIPYCLGGLCLSVMEYLKHLIPNTVNPFGDKVFKADSKTIHPVIILMLVSCLLKHNYFLGTRLKMSHKFNKY